MRKPPAFTGLWSAMAKRNHRDDRSKWFPVLQLAALFLSGPAMTGICTDPLNGKFPRRFCPTIAIGVIRKQTGGYAAVLGAIATALLLRDDSTGIGPYDGAAAQPF